MALDDGCCTIVPYFTVHDGKLDEFKAMCERFVERTSKEPKCLYYGFSFDGHDAHCREGYADAQGVLQHLQNVGQMLKDALEIADMTRLEIHGPADQLSLLREPLSDLGPRYFVMEYGFRR